MIAEDGGENNACIGPVDNIPHVLGQALGVEVFTRPLHAALIVEGGATKALEVELD